MYNVLILSLRQQVSDETDGISAHHLSNFFVAEIRPAHFFCQNCKFRCVEPDRGAAVIIRSQRHMIDTQKVNCVPQGFDDARWRMITDSAFPIANADQATFGCNFAHQIIIEIAG